MRLSLIKTVLALLFAVQSSAWCQQTTRPTSNLDDVEAAVLRLLIDEGVGATPGLAELFDNEILADYLRLRGIDLAAYPDRNKEPEKAAKFVEEVNAALFRIVAPPGIALIDLQRLTHEANDLMKEKFPQRVHDRGYSFVHQVAVASKLTSFANTTTQRRTTEHLFVTRSLDPGKYGNTSVKPCKLSVAAETGVASIQCPMESAVDLGKFLPTDQQGVSADALIAWVHAVLFHEMIHVQLNAHYMQLFAARYGWQEGVTPKSDAERQALQIMIDQAYADLVRFLKRVDIVSLDETFVHLMAARAFVYQGIARAYFNFKNRDYGISYSNMMVFAQNNATTFARFAQPLAETLQTNDRQPLYDELAQVMEIAFTRPSAELPSSPLAYLKLCHDDQRKFASHLIKRYDAKK